MSPAPARKKVGLALGSGAARGLAHIGVLEVLEKEHIPIDIIAGSSAGAAVGAIYAARQDARMMVDEVTLQPRKITPLIDPAFPWAGLIKGTKIKKLLTEYLGGPIHFSDLKIPFACVATDIDTGEEVVIGEGPVVEALRASISVPAIFTVVKRDGRHLVDGGLVNPVPVSVARWMGADIIIAVNVLPDVTDRTGKSGQIRRQRHKEPNIFQTILQTIFISTNSIIRNSLADADVVIEPEVAELGAGEFRKAKEFVAQGEKAAEAALPEIKRLLGQ